MPTIISVIMPTHNDQDYLEGSILSILNQTYSNFEFIIIDDASKDGTDDIVAKYGKLDNRIVAIKNSENIGLAASLNKGLKVARGEWIARMDGDDISHPKRFEIQMDCLQNRDLIYLGTGTELIDRETGKFVKNFNEPLTHGAIAWKLGYASAFVHATTIGRKDAILKAGGYNPNYRKYEDVDLWRRLIFLGNCANLPDILYTYRKPPKTFAVSTKEIVTSVHQAYLKDLTNREEAIDVFYKLIFETNQPSTSDAMRIIGMLVDVFLALEKRGWLIETDYPYIEAEFWKMISQFPEKSGDISRLFCEHFFRYLPAENRDYLYWGNKSSSKILRYLGLAISSPKSFIRKLRAFIS